MYGDGGRLGVVWSAEVVARVGAAGRLDQQVGGGRVSGGRDHADAAPGRAEADHLGAGPQHTSQRLESTQTRAALSGGGGEPMAPSGLLYSARRTNNMPVIS